MARSEKDDGKLRSIRSSTLYRKLRASDRFLTITILWGFGKQTNKTIHYQTLCRRRLAKTRWPEQVTTGVCYFTVPAQTH